MDAFQKFRTGLGNEKCFLLYLNSKKLGEMSSVPDIWSAHFLERYANKSETPAKMEEFADETPNTSDRRHVNSPCGTLLTSGDCKNVDQFITYINKAVLDYMATQINQWEQSVAKPKRANPLRLFNMFQQKHVSSLPSSYTDNDTGLAIFSYKSSEMMLRRLADFGFMVRDYYYAQGVYELLKKEVTGNEKYAKYFAGVQEMLALCILMQQSRSSVDALIDSAFQCYNDSKSEFFASRSSIFISEALKEHGAYREAAQILIKMASDDTLKSAMFLEQAAICYIQSTPPLPRKYAMHLILAGHRYLKCGQV